MAPIYLKHPKHGTKVAIAEAEAKADEKNGWERYEITASAELPPNSRQEAAELPPHVSGTLRVKRPYNRKAA